MDLSSFAQDAGVLAGISTAIFFVIDFVKHVWYKIPYKWAQNTPGTVWFVLSIVLGIIAAVVLDWNDLAGIVASNGSMLSKGGEIVAGLTFGAGSKMIHAISSPAAVKLQAFKLEHQAKVDALTNGAAPGTGADTLINSTGGEPECPAPVPELSTPIAPVEQITEVKLVKEVHPNIDYVIIDGIVYSIKKEGG